MGDFLQRPIIYFWGIMLTVANRVWKQYAFFLHTKSNILRISFSSEETMNVLLSTGFMDSMMSVNADSTLDCGKFLLIVLTAYLWLLL